MECSDKDRFSAVFRLGWSGTPTDAGRGFEGLGSVSGSSCCAAPLPANMLKVFLVLTLADDC